MSIAGAGRKPKSTKSTMDRIFKQVCNVGSGEEQEEDEAEDETDQLESDSDQDLQEVDDGGM